MLGAEGLIGKTVIFIVNKTVGKLIDLPFDKRKKACRSLTKLYYCIQALDDATEEFFKTLDDFGSSKSSEAMVHALNNNMHKIEQASNMFINLGEELSAGLDLIDPNLSKCCDMLYISKFDFLSFMSNSIEWDRSGDLHCLKIKKSSDQMLSVDLEENYKKVVSSIKNGETNYWPSSALDDFDSNIENIQINFEDEITADNFKNHVIKHHALLREAKESLRCLLKDNFSIEEVLFQNDSHPWR